ncbi:MAG: polysaccharide biosynthesis tyrosine autokinase, partial [Bacteroidetes bacterium]
PTEESFQHLRVNLQFSSTDHGGKIISITSTVPQEGKTFCAYHLAVSMARAGQKVILVGADIRKPSLYKLAGIANEKGLTNYLVGQASEAEIVQRSEVPQLDIIPSGPIPPNPADLLSRPQLGTLLQHLGEAYDYVFLDTPPVGLVSDYMIVARHTDISLYVVRQGHSKLGFLRDLQKIKALTPSEKLFIVMNDIQLGMRSYYGRGYGQEAFPSAYGLSQIRRGTGGWEAMPPPRNE